MRAAKDMFVLLEGLSGRFGGNDRAVNKLRAQLDEAKRTADEFARYLAVKWARVEAQKTEWSKLDELRAENARLNE